MSYSAFSLSHPVRSTKCNLKDNLTRQLGEDPCYGRYPSQVVDASNSNLQGPRIVLSPIFSLHDSKASALLLAGNGTSANRDISGYVH